MATTSEITPEEIRIGCSHIDQVLRIVEKKLVAKPLSQSGQKVLLGVRSVLAAVQELDDASLRDIASQVAELEDHGDHE